MFLFEGRFFKLEEAKKEVKTDITVIEKIPVQAKNARVDFQQINDKLFFYRILYFETEKVVGNGVVLEVVVDNIGSKPKVQKGLKFKPYESPFKTITHVSYGEDKTETLSFVLKFRDKWSRNVSISYIPAMDSFEKCLADVEPLLKQFT